MKAASELFGRLLGALALAGCAVLFLMMMVICVDVLLRNVRIVPGMLGLPWANEVTEYALYFITVLTAPWLLRQSQHIRIDILLRAIPPRLAWCCEWAVDALALACCLAMVVYGVKAVFSSLAIQGMVVKVLTVPEWWLLAPLPATFALLAAEVLFRMHRLHAGERGPRSDAVTVT
ncbi:MAG: TRAP transporter small permease subunit [Pseudomonadota bacterium]